jgi:hypothetical protein
MMGLHECIEKGGTRKALKKVNQGFCHFAWLGFFRVVAVPGIVGG